MKIYQRGSVWYIYYSLHNRRIRYVVGTKEEAEEELERIKYELKHEIHQPHKKLIFDNLLEKYLKWAKKHKQPSSYKRNTVSSVPLLKRFSGKFQWMSVMRQLPTNFRLRLVIAINSRQLHITSHQVNGESGLRLIIK